LANIVRIGPLQNWEAVFFTQSHVDRVIDLQDDRSLVNDTVLDTVFAKGRSCVFSLTGRTAASIE